MYKLIGSRQEIAVFNRYNQEITPYNRNNQEITPYSHNQEYSPGLTASSSYSKFKRDSGYSGNFSRPSEHHSSSYQVNLRAGQNLINGILFDLSSDKIEKNAALNEIINLFDNNKISLEQGKEAVKRIMSNEEDTSNSSSKSTEIATISDNPDKIFMPLSPEQINTAMTLGIITPEEQNRMMGGALKSNVSSDTREYFSKTLLPNYEKFAKTNVGNKLRKGSWATAKFTAKTSSKAAMAGGKLIFKSAKSIAMMGFNAQMGGYGSNLILGDVQSSGINMFRHSLGLTSGFTRTSGRVVVSSIQKRIQTYKEYKYHTVTSAEKAKFNKKVEKAKSGNSWDVQNLKKASHKYTQKHAKDAHEVTNFGRLKNATRIVGVGVIGETAKGAVKASAKSGVKALKNSPKAAGKLAGRQMSKIATDNLGQTDETLSSLAGASKSAAKLSFKTLRKTPTVVKKTAKATSTVFKTVRSAVTAVVHGITSVFTTIIANPAIWIPFLTLALIIILIVVVMGSCTATVPTILDFTIESEEDFETYADEDVIKEAEEQYSNAESKLSVYISGLSKEDIISMADPDNKYNLTTENTNTIRYLGTPYHNPYVLISYLCVKYGYDWTIDDVSNEWDFENTNSLIYKQYTIEFEITQNGNEATEENKWDITVRLINNGMDATIREMLSGDDLELYLRMCYNYGESEYNDSNWLGEYWPHDVYQTHSDEITLEEFLNGDTGSFNVDNSTSSTLEHGTSLYDSETGYQWPLDGWYTITSNYGPRWGSYHYGTDIYAPEKTPILACASGTVVDNTWNSARGWLIQIEDASGNKLIYQHMCSQSVVGIGTKVNQGDVIGYVGHTGNVVGNPGDHLHLELWVPDGQTWPYNTRNAMTLFPNL